MAVEFKQAQLANGLRLIAEVDDSAHTAACGFYVKTGTRDEEKNLMGVSHFLEHMMFKGTPRRTADDVNREFDEIGAVFNAFTSHEMTAFWAHVLPECLPKAFDLLADILRPTLREEDFQTERGVILEEIAMYQDQPFWRLYEQAMEVYYGKHPLSYRVLGTNESISAMSRDAMETYFRERYSADNTIITLAGRVNFDDAVAWAEEYCGKWKRTDTSRLHPKATFESSEFTIDDPKVNRQYLLMVTPGPAINDERRYAANMYARLIGEHEGSLLYWSLIEPGIAEEAQAGYDGRDGLGDFYIYASFPTERAEQVESIINDQLENALDRVTPEDLERLRSKTATSVILAGERPSGRMRRLGRQWLYHGRYRSLEDELKRIEAITMDDIRAIAEDYPLTPRTVGRLRPAKS